MHGWWSASVVLLRAYIIGGCTGGSHALDGVHACPGGQPGAISRCLPQVEIASTPTARLCYRVWISAERHQRQSLLGHVFPDYQPNTLEIFTLDDDIVSGSQDPTCIHP